MSQRPEAATNTALATAEGLLADNKTLINDLTAQAGAAGADPAIAQALSEARAANERLTTTTDALRTASDDLASTADSLETEASALDTAAQSASETIRATAGHLPGQRAARHHDQPGFPGGSLRSPGMGSGAGSLPRSPRRGPLGQLGDTLTSSETSAFHHVRFPGHQETNLEQSLTDLTGLQKFRHREDLAE